MFVTLLGTEILRLPHQAMLHPSSSSLSLLSLHIIATISTSSPLACPTFSPSPPISTIIPYLYPTIIICSSPTDLLLEMRRRVSMQPLLLAL
ncbi:unnamed protein product [Onchocerca flexuosa]|uniref:Ovule protein n=1 Tax=Onchocerca flexuosa TaxID=387005 RepID=A0A183H387_9BILA|nr:unnamed protein product [Onchocerca flexuosa]